MTADRGVTEVPWMRVPFESEAQRALGLLLLCRDCGSQATGEDWAAAWERAESAMQAATGYVSPSAWEAS